MLPDQSKGFASDPDFFDVKTSFRNTWTAVKAHKMVVLITTLLCLALVIVYMKIWPPIYRTQAMLMAEPAVDTQRDAFYVNWSVFRKDDARSEIELMTSGSMLKKVIEKEHLTYDDVYHPVMSELTYLWETSYPGIKYKEIRDKIFPPDPEEPQGADRDLGRTINDMHAGITILPVGDTNIGTVDIKGPSRRVAKIANTLIDIYMEERLARHQVEGQKALEILNQEVAKSRNELEDADASRVAYAKKHQLNFELQKQQQEAKDLNELDSAMATNRAKIAALEASLNEVQAQIGLEPTTKRISTTLELNGVREATKIKRLELQTSLISARDRYRPDSPEVTELERDLAKLDALIATQEEHIVQTSTDGLNSLQQALSLSRNGLLTDLAGAKANMSVMEKRATELRNEISDVPDVQKQMRDLDRIFSLAQEKYQALALKKAQAEVSVSTSKATMPSLRVVDYAVPPASRSWPKTKILIPATLLVGLALGVFAALVASLVGGRVRRLDVESGRRGLPLYAVVSAGQAMPPIAVAERRRPALSSAQSGS